MQNDWHEQYPIVLHSTHTFLWDNDEKILNIGAFLLEQKKLSKPQYQDWPCPLGEEKLNVKSRNLDHSIDALQNTFTTPEGIAEGSSPPPELMLKLSIIDIIPKFRSLLQQMRQVHVVLSEFEEEWRKVLLEILNNEDNKEINLRAINISYTNVVTTLENFLTLYDMETGTTLRAPRTPQASARDVYVMLVERKQIAK